MNIFILDKNTVRNAKAHCNTHVIKMTQEICFMLSTVLIKHNQQAPFKATHQHHPCTIFVGLNQSNFKFTRKLGLELCKEYTHRYGKRLQVQDYLEQMKVPESLTKGKLTEFAQAMPDQYRDIDAVKAYRNYYLGEKLCQKSWRWEYKNREKPEWARVLDEI